MPDAPDCDAVSLSCALGPETPRHFPEKQDMPETAPATTDLKALARLVLARDTRRDAGRDSLSRNLDTDEGPKRQAVRALLTEESPTLPEANQLLAPLFQPLSPVDGEPGFDQPCDTRRGRVEERPDGFLHFCLVCGRWGAFGYGVSLRRGRLGHWYCAAHRP
jgi:hypothetical protein